MHFLRTAPRAIAAFATALAVVNIVHLCALLVQAAVEGEQAVSPARLASQLVLLSLGPAAIAFAVRLTGRASWSVDADRLIVRHRRAQTEIPLGSVAGVRLSRLPFPAPALALRMKSGRTLPERLELPDPSRLLESLAPHVPRAGPLQSHPLVALARARAPMLRHRTRRLIVKFVLFPLLPALIAFRAHQYIAFGGPFGEYRLLGAAAYARTLATYVTTTIVLLVLYAAAWRIAAEAFAALATALFPDRAPTWRRAAEVLCALVYYLGIPALLAVRFLA